MKIIISPAKKMKEQPDLYPCRDLPCFLQETRILAEWIKGLSYEQAKELWKCSDAIARQNYERFQQMNLEGNLTAAVLAYEGIQYQYMAPAVLEEQEMEYIQNTLYILSGFYGVLRPLDGITPYRLEMQAKADVDGRGNLYAFWGDRIYRKVTEEDRTVLNLASKEYARCVEKYLTPEDRFITCVFGTVEGGRVRQKSTAAKMARGEMVRYLARRGAVKPEEAKGFDCLGYRFREELSGPDSYVFIRTDPDCL